MSRTALALTLMLLLWPGPLDAAEVFGIAVRSRLDRVRVVTHEQVVMQVGVDHPSDVGVRWIPPTFEGFWTEKLATRSHDPSRGEDDTTRTTVFRRALFPAHPGAFEIDSSTLEVRSGDRLVEFEVPGARLLVIEVPSRIPPDPATPIVGQLEVGASLRRHTVELGKFVQLTVEVHGNANVWDLPPLELEPLIGEDFEVFDDPPRDFVGERAGRASTRRSFRFQLVPRRAGRFEIPAFEVPYFDTVSRLHTIARSEPVAFEVVARAVTAARSPWDPAPEPPPRTRSPWPLLGLVLAAGLITALWLRRWRRASRTRLGTEPLPSPRAAYEAAREAAPGERFLTELVSAVKAGVWARHGLDPRALTTDEIAARVDDPEAVALLEALDRARYAQRDPAAEPLLTRVRTYLGL